MNQRKANLIGALAGAGILAATAAGLYILYRKAAVRQAELDLDDRPEDDKIVWIKPPAGKAEDAEDEAEAKASAMDLSGDGNPDTVFMDTTGDGNPDLVLSDTDGDGVVDTALIDLDGDGTYDAAVTDLELGDEAEGEQAKA